MVLTSDVLECENCGGLLVDDSAKTGLALHDDIGDAHLTAEGGKADDELNWVNIMSNDNE